MRNIAIIGHGGYADVLKDTIASLGLYCFKGFIGKNNDIETEYNETCLNKLKEDNINHLANGVGNMSYSWVENMIKRYLNGSFKFPEIVNPSAIVSNKSTIGEGTVVLENAVIKSNASIGKFCIINSLSLVSHDCRIEDYVHVSLGAKISGECKVGKNSFLGINASVIQGKKIGKNVVIGAGAVIIDDIPDNVVVVGNPGRIIRQRK